MKKSKVIDMIEKTVFLLNSINRLFQKKKRREVKKMVEKIPKRREVKRMISNVLNWLESIGFKGDDDLPPGGFRN